MTYAEKKEIIIVIGVLILIGLGGFAIYEILAKGFWFHIERFPR